MAQPKTVNIVHIMNKKMVIRLLKTSLTFTFLWILFDEMKAVGNRNIQISKKYLHQVENEMYCEGQCFLKLIITKIQR